MALLHNTYVFQLPPLATSLTNGVELVRQAHPSHFLTTSSNTVRFLAVYDIAVLAA